MPDFYRRDPPPADRSFGERGLPPERRRDFENPPPSRFSDRGYGALLGIIAFIGILLLGALFYYVTLPEDISNAADSPSTTSTEPRSDRRPGTPVPPGPPAGPRQAQ